MQAAVGGAPADGQGEGVVVAVAETLRVGFPFPAIMGYANMREKGFALRVCSWCPTAKQGTAWAAPLPVTHGICPACYQRQMGGFLGEKV